MEESQRRKIKITPAPWMVELLCVSKSKILGSENGSEEAQVFSRRIRIRQNRGLPRISPIRETQTSKLWRFLFDEQGVCLLIAFRFSNALLLQTYFNPDEYWQALEVAHKITLGYCHLTWEWKRGIRSYFHPLLFAFLYKVLALLGLDTLLFMIRAPRLLQSIFSAVGDFYLYKLSTALFGDYVAKWVLFSQLTNWFMLFCFNRTLSNNLETVLTLVSLYYWPCIRGHPTKFSKVSRKLALCMAALSCALHPKSAITWLYVGLLELFSARDRLRFILLEAAPIGWRSKEQRKGVMLGHVQFS